jgi:hypothetical protein
VLSRWPILRIRELGASRASPSYSSRSRKVCDRIFAKEAITATLQTDASPSEPDRRSASVRCSASAAFGKGSAVISIHTDTGFRLRILPLVQPPCRIWVSHDGVEPTAGPAMSAIPRSRSSFVLQQNFVMCQQETCAVIRIAAPRNHECIPQPRSD